MGWADQFSLDALGLASEVFGTGALFGPKAKANGADALAKATDAGFAILREGPTGVSKLFDRLRCGAGHPQDRPQARYGRIHAWLKRGARSTDEFEVLRALLRDHFERNWWRRVNLGGSPQQRSKPKRQRCRITARPSIALNGAVSIEQVRRMPESSASGRRIRSRRMAASGGGAAQPSNGKSSCQFFCQRSDMCARARVSSWPRSEAVAQFVIGRVR